MKAVSIPYIDWLLPPTEPKATLFDSLPKPKNLIDSLLTDIQQLKDTYLQYKFGKVALFKDGTEVSDIDYRHYLQFPNYEIKSAAMKIVARSDSDDTKAWKLLRWIQDNIQYKDDIKNYGQDEYWALPTVTLKKQEGDCEDGAYLLASMMLNAGVHADRVRVYGGFVSAGTNASTGGHAWVAYKREVDNQWVALDWCYFPTTEPVNIRETLKQDTKYLDDYFYVTTFETVDTSYYNTLRIRKAMSAYKHKPEVKSTLDLII